MFRVMFNEIISSHRAPMQIDVQSIQTYRNILTEHPISLDLQLFLFVRLRLFMKMAFTPPEEMPVNLSLILEPTTLER